MQVEHKKDETKVDKSVCSKSPLKLEKVTSCLSRREVQDWMIGKEHGVEECVRRQNEVNTVLLACKICVDVLVKYLDSEIGGNNQPNSDTELE